MRVAPIVALLSACGTSKIEQYRQTGRITQLEAGFVSAFVLEAGDDVALFDAGQQKDGEDLKSGLRACGFEPSDVTHLFVTHHHGDHLGAIPTFHNAVVMAHQNEVDAVEAERDEVTVDRPLGDGEVVTLADGTRVETLHAPGHTPGNLVFLVDGVLVMGDTAVAKKDGSLAPAPRFFSEDPDQAETALVDLADRVAERDIDWMVFAHSGPLEGVQPLLDYAP